MLDLALELFDEGKVHRTTPLQPSAHRGFCTWLCILAPPQPALDLPPPSDRGPESSSQLLAEPLRALNCSASMHSG